MVSTLGEVTKKLKRTITVDTNKKIQFRDTGIYIQSSADGKLTFSADGGGSDDFIFAGSVTFQNDITVQGDFTFGNAATDNLTVNGDLIVADDQKLHFGTGEDVSIEYDEDGTDDLRVTGADWVFDDDLKLYFGTGKDAYLEYDEDGNDTLSIGGTDVLIEDDLKLYFGSGKDASIEYDEDGHDTLTIAGAVLELGQAGGAAAANALLLGVGTSGDPATTAVANKNFIELRCQTTATSGDNRLGYMRYDIAGAGAGGESLRTFTKVSAAATTCRGSHISLDVAAAGSCSGLGVGVDNQILVHDGALTGGTYASGNFEIYSAGSSTDVSGVTQMSFLRVVAGGDATGIANVDDNAFFAAFAGVAAGSGNMIDTDITTHTAYGGLRVSIPGVGTRYLALVSD